MAASILGRLCRKLSAARISPAGSYNSSFGFCGRRVAATAGMSTLNDAVSYHAVRNLPSTLPSRTSPWLMLPPSFQDEAWNNNNIIYNFYSLADNKVLTNFNNRLISGFTHMELPQLKGSSHGWLALFNPDNLDLFLSNPLSGRHIKLPSIRNLPIAKCNLEGGYGCVQNLIISSSSPDDEDCRAILTYAPNDSLAFCCPGRSNTEWTPIGTTINYEHCVYSNRHNLLFCVTHRERFEAWNLQDPSSPKCIPMDIYADDDDYPFPARSEEERILKESCQSQKFLVVAEANSTADLLLVRRLTLQEIAPDGSNAQIDPTEYTFDANGMRYPYKTICFEVHRVCIDGKEKEMKYMDGSLDGLAIFIGSNHSFALRASDFPELKPNSIYYTDVRDLIYRCDDENVCKFGGHDIGIYNYEDKTFSPCYYPCDVQSIRRLNPAPIWFTPSPPLS